MNMSDQTTRRNKTPEELQQEEDDYWFQWGWDEAKRRAEDEMCFPDRGISNDL